MAVLGFVLEKKERIVLICLIHVAVDGADTRSFYNADCDVETFESLRSQFREEYARRLATVEASQPSPLGNEAVLAFLGFLRDLQIRTTPVTENTGNPDVQFCYSHSFPAQV